jgi:hypothetical protein
MMGIVGGLWVSGVDCGAQASRNRKTKKRGTGRAFDWGEVNLVQARTASH